MNKLSKSSSFFFACILFSNLSLEAGEPSDSYSPAISLGKGAQPGIAVDQQNRLHLIYSAGGKVMYRLGSTNGNFGPPETAMSIGVVWDPRIYVDANDVPHIIAANGHYQNTFTYYTNKIGGSWKTQFAVFDKAKDLLNRVTCPTLFLHGDKAYAGVFTVTGDAGRVWGALAIIENLASPKRTKFLRNNEWAPQIFVSGGKLWVGGRNTATGSMGYTFQEKDMATLEGKGSNVTLSSSSGELGRANITSDGEIMAAGTTKSSSSSSAGWYNSLSRAKSGKGGISYRTSLHNPCGQGFPVKDLVAKDRVYVFHWSDEDATTHEDEGCGAKAQLHFARIENGSKASELNPVTSRTGGHGPSFRTTPGAAALKGGGVVTVFGECSGEIYMSIIGETKPISIKKLNIVPSAYGAILNLFTVQGRIRPL